MLPKFLVFPFNFEQQQHAASAKHFSSGQRYSPKTSSNHEMSEKVRDSMFDSIVETRKQARDKQRTGVKVFLGGEIQVSRFSLEWEVEVEEDQKMNYPVNIVAGVPRVADRTK